MQTEALFMGKPISYWVDLEETYQKFAHILELPQVKRIIIEHELKMLDHKRELLCSQLTDTEEYING